MVTNVCSRLYVDDEYKIVDDPKLSVSQMDTDDTLLVQMVGILANVKRAVEYLMDKELMQLVVFFLLYYSPFDLHRKYKLFNQLVSS